MGKIKQVMKLSAPARSRQALTPPPALRQAQDAALTGEISRVRAPLRLARATLQAELAAGERREYAVQFIKAGRVMGRDGKPVNWEIPATTLQAAVPLLDSVASFIDHPSDGFWGPENASMRDMAAVTADPEWNNANQSIDGKIRLYSRPDLDWLRILLDQVVEDMDAGRETPNVGGSLVFWGRHDWVDVGENPGEEFLRVTTEITHVESWDIVFGPGADGRIKEILSAAGIKRPKFQSQNGGRPMNFCSECGSRLHKGECPHCAATQEAQNQLANAAAPDGTPVGAPAAAGQQTRPAGRQTGNTQKTGSRQVKPAPGQSQGQQGDTPGDSEEQDLPDPAEALGLLNSNLNQLQQVLTDQSRREQSQMILGLAERFDEVLDTLQSNSRSTLIDIGGRAPNDRRGPGRHMLMTQRDELEQFGEVVDWLFGVKGAKVPDPEYRKADMIYIALTGDYEFRGVFQPERVKLAAANPATLANMAVDAMNKVIMTQFSALTFWRWYERITAVVPNDGTLNDAKWITFGGISNLPVVDDGASYTELDVDDVKESNAFNKHGGFVGITRKMIRNSNIAQIQAVPRALAAAAVRTRSAAVSSIFTSNAGVGPTLAQDSKALFHTDHGNLLTTAFGTDATAWRAARAESFQHAEVNSGKPLGVFPRFGLFPPELYDIALSVFGYGEGYPTAYAPEAQDRGNEDPRPVPLAVPDWTDATDWAYVVDPAVYPVIQMSYSQASGGGMHPAPELFIVTSETAGLVFTNDTLPIKVRDEFAVGVNGPRGIGKRNVAG